MKKLGLLFVTILMMMLFAVSANALDTKGQCGDDVYWEYNLTSKELVISGTGATRNYKYKTSPFYDGDFETLIIKDGVIDGYYQVDKKNYAMSV